MKQDTIEIRWHGRGGQGAVTSAEMTALAAVHEDKFAQAFPSFGPERRGAPVLAFNRISPSHAIRNRAGVTKPDIVVVLDPGLVTLINVTDGLKPGGSLIVNSTKAIEELQQEFTGDWKLAVVDAASIARKLLGVNIVNTTMLGAMIKATGIVKLESFAAPLEHRFGARAKANFNACSAAFDATVLSEITTSGPKKQKSFKVDKVPGWRDLLVGCAVTDIGNTKRFCTGDWKSQHPEWDNTKCIKCGICSLFCPEACIHEQADWYFRADLFFCKGCGICAHECWTQAIKMVEEA
ncbi:MAG: 2-oxoacid:acceptor oxidoreductase family protein [Dehalococcoidia bacterium]|nr:2-oxoacid:acceptor oxidoreductase family protein [Dehalococcoidia bacterium]MDD5493103.1 2-oxoacid:acceptor oxidoreductase family protein [Dehalococcoidia bacterium]